jgi:hypothetical protein
VYNDRKPGEVNMERPKHTNGSRLVIAAMGEVAAFSVPAVVQWPNNPAAGLPCAPDSEPSLSVPAREHPMAGPVFRELRRATRCGDDHEGMNGAIFYEVEGELRQFFLDGPTLFEDPNPIWLGHSVRHKEGETLAGLDDNTWRRAG